MNLLVFGDTSTWNISNFSIKKINKDIKESINLADFVIYNLEGPIKLENKKYKFEIRKNKVMNFILKLLLKLSKKEQPIVNSNKNIIELFKMNRNSIVTLANNHIKDLGIDGYKETIKILKENKIKYIGAGKNNKEASNDVIIRGNAIINCNFVGSKKNNIEFKIYNATKDSFGSSYQTVSDLKSKIKKYKKKNIKSILIIHGGKEMPKNNNLGINLKEIKSINADYTIIHHFHKYIKTIYEKNKIYCIGDFIFRRPKKLPTSRKTAFIKITDNSVKIEKYNNMTEIYNE